MYIVWAGVILVILIPNFGTIIFSIKSAAAGRPMLMLPKTLQLQLFGDAGKHRDQDSKRMAECWAAARESSRIDPPSEAARQLEKVLVHGCTSNFGCKYMAMLLSTTSPTQLAGPRVGMHKRKHKRWCA